MLQSTRVAVTAVLGQPLCDAGLQLPRILTGRLSRIYDVDGVSEVGLHDS
jgi:hypothetical protein